MRMCYWKNIASSPSIEGKTFREQHPEIPFKRCNYLCSGYGDYGTCEHYEIREIDEVQAEKLVGRLEEFLI